MTTTVDIRCPVGPRRLLAKLVQSGEEPVYVPGNLLELSCLYCRDEIRRRGDRATLVLHRFNILGELVETEIVP